MRARAGTRYEVVLSVTAILAVAVAISASPIGAAQTFSVTTTSDATDVMPGDGRCDIDAVQSGDQCALRAAVMESNASTGADTINLSAGTYVLTLPSPDPAGPDASVGDLDITDDLTISGAGPDSTIVAGGAGWNDRLLEVNFGSDAGNLELSLSGVTLTKGKSADVGGGLYFTDVGGTLSLSAMKVVGNTAGTSAGDNGGGAYVRAKAFTLHGVVFEGNTAGGSGGGLHIHPPPDASATDAHGVTFDGNHAGGHGGGLATTGPAGFVATDLQARDNVAGESSNGAGGGLSLGATDAVLRDVAITGNRSTGDGGGISTNAPLQITGGVIRTNTTGNGGPHGGGISFAASAAALSLTDLAIEGNKSNDGGGMWVNAATLTAEHVSISNNEVIPNPNGSFVNYWTGGAWVSVPPTGSATIVNATFTGNQGGILASGSAATPSAITFNGSPANKPLLRNVTIARNRGGTAALSLYFGTVEIENTVVAENAGANCAGSGSGITSLGGNLEQGTGSCGFSPGDAKLGQPTSVGDTTIVPLGPGSQAIDRPLANCPDDDQVGTSRPKDGDLDGTALCDIGAFEVDPPPPAADLRITKSDSPDPVQVGQELTYTLSVTNTPTQSATSAAANVVVIDTLPAGVAFGSVTPSQGSCSGTTTVSCQLGTIASGRSATVTIEATPSTEDDLSNTASVSSSTGDPDMTNNADGETTVVNAAPAAAADLSVTKSSAPDPVRVGQELTYTITVSNGGPSPAVGTTLTDVLPGNVTFGSAAASQGSCSGTTTLTCSLGTVASGASATIVVKVTPTTDADLSNTATATSTTADPNLLNNSATESTVVSPPSADLVLTKTAPAAVAVRGPITYALTVRNAGPDAASSFTVTDTLPAGVTNPRSLSSGCTAAAGTITCGGGSLTVGQTASFGFTVSAPATVGSVTNTAAITASAPADAVPANDTASATTQVQPPGVDLSLTHSAPTLVVLGGTYALRATVTNNGPGTATNVRVTEQLRYAGDKDGLRYVSGPASCATSGSASTVVCSAASLAPGSSVTFDLTLKPYLECTLLGTLGDDTLTGTPTRDVICGGAGNDTIAGGVGRDVLLGMGPSGRGVRAIGSVAADQTETVPGNETANTQTTVGGPAYANDRDTMDGQEGSDEIDGGYGSDTLRGGADDDTIQGGPGTDTIWGEGGSDLLEGGPGLDTIYGGIGGDELHGGPGQRDPETGDWTPDVAPNYLDGGPGQDFCSKGKPPDKRVSCERP
jgi:uncharacterized repeat protein (TIGR01451 family)